MCSSSLPDDSCKESPDKVHHFFLAGTPIWDGKKYIYVNVNWFCKYCLKLSNSIVSVK